MNTKILTNAGIRPTAGHTSHQKAVDVHTHNKSTLTSKYMRHKTMISISKYKLYQTPTDIQH